MSPVLKPSLASRSVAVRSSQQKSHNEWAFNKATALASAGAIGAGVYAFHERRKRKQAEFNKNITQENLENVSNELAQLKDIYGKKFQNLANQNELITHNKVNSDYMAIVLNAHELNQDLMRIWKGIKNVHDDEYVSSALNYALEGKNISFEEIGKSAKYLKLFAYLSPEINKTIFSLRSSLSMTFLAAEKVVDRYISRELRLEELEHFSKLIEQNEFHARKMSSLFKTLW